MLETSIIIRTKNEEQWIRINLEKLFCQTYKNFEIIVIDSGSTDRTLEIVRKFSVKIFEIPFEKFSYPYALNFGIEKSSALKYIVIISAHSLPISDTWLQDGLNNFKNHQNIMGVYGYVKALPGSSIWDKLFLDWTGFFRRVITLNKLKSHLVESGRMGVMGFTNAIILKDLWNRRKFNEAYGMRGEDGEWADYWFSKGYKAIRDANFTVRHSHNLSLYG
ncbi:MAG: glycosyltransferase family A protein [Patescibacteria group bacterium]|nr:glycosyltransferase family A protein [Patescibacteria group bacterium]